jgi:hypothetical protein
VMIAAFMLKLHYKFRPTDDFVIDLTAMLWHLCRCNPTGAAPRERFTARRLSALRTKPTTACFRCGCPKSQQSRWCTRPHFFRPSTSIQLRFPLLQRVTSRSINRCNALRSTVSQILKL